MSLMENNFERKDLEDKIFCAKCGALVEETLLLSCEHNLCLPCAAKNLFKEDSKNIHKYKVL
jgi:DNA-directed RNA polymerase subunit RPC12/RpoP